MHTIRLWWFSACLLICVGGIGKAGAELVSLDSQYGPASITRDTSSGLRWLDLTLTAGLSYNAVSSGIGNTWLADGWRYATTEEIRQLLTSNLPSAVTGPEPSPPVPGFYAEWQPDSSREAALLVALLGDTYALIGATETPGATGIYGRQASAPGDPEVTHNLAAIVRNLPDSTFLATMHGGAYDAEGHGYVGHFLVMPTAVPEPSALSLLLVGLCAAALAARRRRTVQ